MADRRRTCYSPASMPLSLQSVMKQKLVAALLALVLLAGCGATGTQFKPELNKPDGNRALLYVYRPDTIIGVGNADVPFIHLDGQRLARIRIGGYLAIPVSTGRHKLTTTESLLGKDTGKVRGETTFAAPAGSTVSLRYTEGFKRITPIALPTGIFVESTGEYRFEYVPEAEAVIEMAKTKALEPDGITQ
jgi:hypothetical protein